MCKFRFTLCEECLTFIDGCRDGPDDPSCPCYDPRAHQYVQVTLNWKHRYEPGNPPWLREQLAKVPVGRSADKPDPRPQPANWVPYWPSPWLDGSLLNVQIWLTGSCQSCRGRDGNAKKFDWNWEYDYLYEIAEGECIKWHGELKKFWPRQQLSSYEYTLAVYALCSAFRSYPVLEILTSNEKTWNQKLVDNNEAVDLECLKDFEYISEYIDAGEVDKDAEATKLISPDSKSD